MCIGPRDGWHGTFLALANCCKCIKAFGEVGSVEDLSGRPAYLGLKIHPVKERVNLSYMNCQHGSPQDTIGKAECTLTLGSVKWSEYMYTTVLTPSDET